MSEYQFIHFLSLDRPLDEEQLQFMERQSSRARITPLEFANEYHYGDFHGNAPEMLRRGYDVHLHYANFGMRRLWIRLPAGLTCDKKVFKAFRIEHCVEWKPDKEASGGIVQIEPEADAGTFDEELFDVDTMLPKIAPIRDLLISGDLRPLYLAWLACAYDDESLEPPVPAGLDQLTLALCAMAEFYEVSEDLVAAAAERSPPLPAAADASRVLSDWIAKQSKQDLADLAARLLTEDLVATRNETLARIRDEAGTPAWPMAEPARTLAQLKQSAERLSQQRLQREQKACESARRKRLAAMAKDPQKTVAKVEKLVGERSTRSYQQAAKELADLGEALGPERGPEQSQAAAARLRKAYPTARGLVSELRKRGLL